MWRHIPLLPFQQLQVILHPRKIQSFSQQVTITFINLPPSLTD